MKYVNYQKCWHEIPEQDRIARGNIAIVKDSRDRCYNTTMNKYTGHVVLLNPLQKNVEIDGGAIITLGLFWAEADAVIFAEAYILIHKKKMKCKYEPYHQCVNEATRGDYCEKHSSLKCVVCGKQATHGCVYSGQLQCGQPLCDDCE